MKKINRQLLVELNELEFALQRADLWSDQPPLPAQLLSNEPFCIDTLDFNEWLQWVFIARLQQMIEQGQFQSLPNRSDIAGMAEEVYKEQGAKLREILPILQEIDKLLNSLQTLQ